MTKRSLRPLILTCLSTLAMISLGACRELLVEPAPELPATLNLSVALAGSSPGGAGGVGVAVDRARTSPADVAQSTDAAFDAADRVQIRLLRGERVAADVEQEFAPERAETRIRLEVEVEEGGETLALELVLSSQGQPLFNSGLSVQLRPGESTSVEVPLEPVPAGVEIQGGPLVLEGIGAEAQLSGVVVFATGHPIPGLDPTWTSSAPEVAEVSQDGRVKAVGPGDAFITGAYQGFSAGVSVTVQAVAVHFPDPNLEAAVRQAIGKPEGAIFGSELAALTALEAPFAGIADLTGLEHAVGLTLLQAGGNDISDLTPLAGLTQLTSLGLAVNPISDLSPLAGLGQLAFLELAGHPISDLAPLSSLTSLTTLLLVEISQPDLSALAGLTQLVTLATPRNEVTDLRPLEDLVNLRLLNLGNNLIEDVSPLEPLTQLESLTLDSNQVDEIGALVANEGLGEGDVVRLLNNPLGPNARCVDVPLLESRGVMVTRSPPACQRSTVSIQSITSGGSPVPLNDVQGTIDVEVGVQPNDEVPVRVELRASGTVVAFQDLEGGTPGGVEPFSIVFGFDTNQISNGTHVLEAWVVTQAGSQPAHTSSVTITVNN